VQEKHLVQASNHPRLPITLPPEIHMILVTGAMGRIGSAALAALHARGLPSRAIVPSRRRVPWLAELQTELVEGEADNPLVLEQALDGIRAVILLARPSATQVDGQRRIIDACNARGIARIVKLSVAGASETAPADAARWHWRAEQHLLQEAEEPCIARIGRTMQDLLLQEPLLLAHHMLVGCQGDGLAADVDARDVGAVLAGLASASAPSRLPVLVTGPEALTRHKAAALLGSALGFPIRYVPCTPGDLTQLLLGAGSCQWQVDDLVLYESAAAMGDWKCVTDVVSQWTGHQARTFSAFANEMAASLQYSHGLPQGAGHARDQLPVAAQH
jgi:uncharacterized protein YbjT (DUF2867 family)